MTDHATQDEFNPGVDRVWDSFPRGGEARVPSVDVESQAALAGRAILDASVEKEGVRVNQQRGIVKYGPDEPSAIVFNKKSTDVVSFNVGAGPDNHKYVSSTIGTYVLQTDSGNYYVIDPVDGIVISARGGKVYTDVYQLPDIEFGDPWEVEGKFKTTRVTQLLSEYKVGEVNEDFRSDDESPFVWAHKAIDQAVAKLNESR